MFYNLLPTMYFVNSDEMSHKNGADKRKKKDLLRHFMHTFCDGDQKLGVVEFNVLLDS